MPSQNTSATSSPPLDKWDYRFIRVAREVQSWSKDPGTKVGAVLVKDRRIIATGYNGFPQGLSDSLDRYADREYKLMVTVHGEQNAIQNAARNGTKLVGSTAYVTWPPCSQCAAALIQAGVEKVVCPHPSTGPERWVRNFALANDLLLEACVKVLYYSDSDPCLTGTAQFAERSGSTVSSTGPQASQAATSTSTHLSVADLLPRRLTDA